MCMNEKSTVLASQCTSSVYVENRQLNQQFIELSKQMKILAKSNKRRRQWQR